MIKQVIEMLWRFTVALVVANILFILVGTTFSSKLFSGFLVLWGHNTRECRNV